jgi:hypothetical protein
MGNNHSGVAAALPRDILTERKWTCKNFMQVLFPTFLKSPHQSSVFHAIGNINTFKCLSK